ncbi:MAG: Coenzyme F420 hydrogenase/dehydrogenase, beta subunit C-terminal domain [Lachnospiraceae bacterium]|jgi:coenzyme F420-reducing hydrogenase beta subunit|nr:Coenzyme F420 hydrogenase/dehydrogenase, beta subunit C-terminal domain [Lachnospiraceae bacterium]MCI1656819.1 Coenzyme F420 hydrogenase/dehydrogenase, beta subunit C-terminal domain [Lachnospiraceae bacterium]MCI2195175.1 Coenzyme F420 hydrogenase/dehydrogenase, beta subunit C-terminal domain [Lachnospiraceae bacterium]
MLYFLKEKHDCTGCSACVANCPVNCIIMKEDIEGFLYPTASDDCIHCGKCERTCPQRLYNSVKSAVDMPQEAYAALSKDYKIWKRSASGGAFSEICKAWDKNAYFVGARWNGLTVQEDIIQGIENITPLCKSKYIYSNPGNCFSNIKELLDAEKKVLFAGTPCQVAGLKSFLTREYSNLLLVDLICHGVGSPKVFNECLNDLETQFGSKVKGYEFRSKRDAYEADYLSRIEFENGKKVYVLKDPYNQLFLQQKCLRPSCGKYCKYRSNKRQGDITIADYKGLTQVFPELRGTNRNYSTIVINSSRGKDLFEKMQTISIKKCEMKDIENYNPLFFHQTFYSDLRDAFFEKFSESPQSAIKDNTSQLIISKRHFARRIFDSLPFRIRRIVIRLLKRG